ncbi:MAG TPA: short-chain fatty acid transporter [Saprospirales bacterium]|nr:short-chain fatty acid transporter [Saprospirales bacterium]HRQ30922.1 AbgT family transporter [Saprospiraceae bacterium]
MAFKLKVPHTYVIVFSIVILAGMLTWIVPGGAYDYETQTVHGIERNVVINGSFHYVENTPQTWQIFSAIFDGFVDKADIIVFILLIGGAFWIMNQTKAIDIGIYSFLRRTKKLERFKALRFLGIDNIIIVLIMLLFSVFGAVFGMSEETIAFTIIFVPLSIKMGYDSIIGLSMCFVGAGLGFAGAILNPFTIGIAQGLSDLPLFSGIEYRLFSWLIINITGISYVLWYARKIKKDPEKSGMFQLDEYWRKITASGETIPEYHTPTSGWFVFAVLQIVLVIFAWQNPQTTMTIGLSGFTAPLLPILAGLFFISSILLLRKSIHFFIINLLMFTILYLIVGVMGYEWYIMEIATLFFVMGIASGLAFDFKLNEMTNHFLDGVRDILSAGLIVGLAGGIIIILQKGQVIDTLLHGASTAMSGMGKYGSLSVMYIIQTMINLVLPSGSAKAALTMPIMSQFSDLIDLSRQAAVMAYQLGDGFTNMITPTSGVLMGVLGVAKIPFDKWVKWIWPLMLILIILGFLLLIPTITIQLNGF